MHQLNPNLEKFWTTRRDVKVLKGGRASGKTWDAAAMAVYLSANYTLKFLCVRQFQANISDSVFTVIASMIEKMGYASEFEILKSSITHKTNGSEFLFYGFQRNTASIKGTEGVDICWIEEAEGLTKEQWGIIEPTIRKEGSECWVLYNPRIISDFVECHFIDSEENGILVRHINYEENPFLSETMLRKINRLKSQDYEEYEHIYLGLAKSDDDDVVIKRSWIEAAIDAHIKLDIEISGSKRIGFDIADSGNDLCSQIYAHGIVALWGEHWKGKEDELLKSSTRVYNKALEYGASIDYDSIGVGASAGSKFSDLNKESGKKVNYSKFIAGAGVANPKAYYIDVEDEKITNKDFFSNLKAQSWWCVADRFRNTYNAVVNGEKFEDDELISISSDMPNLANLVTELSTPRRDFDKAGKVKVESKDDLKKRDVPSPNDADAFIMAYAPQESQPTAMIW